MSQAQEKLRSTESEIRTLKTFLTTKTAMIEKFKKELRETKTMVSELLEKDERRAVILADVLEKTARQYQQQVGTVRSAHGKQMLLDAVHTPVETRFVQTLMHCIANLIFIICIVHPGSNHFLFNETRH